MAGTDETDHLEDAGIIPDVADAGNAVVDDRTADHLSKCTRVGLVKRSGRYGLQGGVEFARSIKKLNPIEQLKRKLHRIHEQGGVRVVKGPDPSRAGYSILLRPSSFVHHTFYSSAQQTDRNDKANRNPDVRGLSFIVINPHIKPTPLPSTPTLVSLFAQSWRLMGFLLT